MYRCFGPASWAVHDGETPTAHRARVPVQREGWEKVETMGDLGCTADPDVWDQHVVVQGRGWGSCSRCWNISILSHADLPLHGFCTECRQGCMSL